MWREKDRPPPLRNTFLRSSPQTALTMPPLLALEFLGPPFLRARADRAPCPQAPLGAPLLASRAPPSPGAAAAAAAFAQAAAEAAAAGACAAAAASAPRPPVRFPLADKTGASC